jgi:hypothetical protein
VIGNEHVDGTEPICRALDHPSRCVGVREVAFDVVEPI